MSHAQSTPQFVGVLAKSNLFKLECNARASAKAAVPALIVLELAQGVLRMGQEIEIRPGIVSKDAEGKASCVPIYSRIVSLFAEQNSLQYAVPGGLIGVGTTVQLLCPGKAVHECKPQ